MNSHQANKQESRQNEELAAFTDALLERDAEEIEQRPPLADTVELLARVLASEPPPDQLQRRIHRIIAEEWDAAPHRPRFYEMFQIRRRPIWVAAVAALAVLAVATVLLVTPGAEGIVGTAGGGAWLAPLIIVLILLAAGFVGWTFWRR